MTDISLTAAQIRPLTENGAVLRRYTAGASITIGDAVYVASDGDVEPADGNAVASARAIGIAVASYDGETSVNSGDPVTVCVFGPVSGFSGMTPGANHYVSDEAGNVADSAGTCSRIIGYAESATVLFVHPEQNDPSST